MNTNMRRIILVLAGIVLPLFTASSSTACSTPGLQPGGASWAPNADVAVNTTGVPSVVTTAIANWNLTFTAFGICDAPTLIASSTLGGAPSIAMSYVAIANVPCPTVQNPSAMCARRGITNYISFVAGYLVKATIQLNNQMTASAAITEVAAHEIGHTFGLADCNGCALNSTVMESNPTGGPFTVNSVVGTPGPTSCDVIEVAFVKSPGYLCPPQSTCPNPQGQPPAGCSNAQWDTVSCTWTCSGSPIIIDISGQGFSLTNAANGVTFDISGTGHPVQMGWTAQGADNAFLALPGADGLVHNGKQLFGNFTPQPKSTTPNGFAALAVYDLPANGGNGDGVIDAKDAIFSSLRLWIDTNHDGISQPEEIHTLSELGVTSISLDYHEDKRQDEYGNVFRYRAKINPDDTDRSHVGRIAYDVFFVGLGPVAKLIPLPGPPVMKCSVPAHKVGMLAVTPAALR